MGMRHLLRTIVRRPRAWTAPALLPLLLAATACEIERRGGEAPPPPPSALPAEIVESPRSVTLPDGGQLSWRTSPDPWPLNRHTDLRLRLERSPLRIVAIDAIMPDHGHGMNTTPVTRTTRSGDVVARGLLLHMPGHWRLDVTLAAPDGSTTVTGFDLLCCPD